MVGGVDASKTAENLFYAEAAVRYVKSKVVHGASNKWEDIKKGGILTLGGTLESRIGSIFNTGGMSDEEKIKYFAQQAERYGVGNCGEQSSLAFVYLDNIGVRPLDLVEFLNKNHGLVVIGRVDNTGSDPVNWGPAAVVADPWLGSGMWYRAVELSKHWPGATPGLRFGKR